MKNLTLFLITFFAINNTCFGQFILSKHKSQFTGVRASVGGYYDDFHNISMEGLLSLIKSDQSYDFNPSLYQEGEYYAALSGGNIGFEAIFHPKGPDGEAKLKQELRIGASANIAREAMLDVERLNGGYDYLTLCIIENEFLINSAYIFKAPYFGGLFDVYAGPGVSVGSTFGNEFIFLGGTDQSSLEAKNSSYFRGTIIAGGSINLRRFFYQMEGAIGLGTQVVHDGRANTFNTGNFRFAIGYRL